MASKITLKEISMLGAIANFWCKKLILDYKKHNYSKQNIVQLCSKS
jgi:hypothetical protein